MTPVRGENTKAILVFGDAERALVPFVFEGVTYRVPAALIRHHPNHPDCPVLEEALHARNSWKELVTKGAVMRARTVRCTGGCWSGFEKSEQRRIARGDERALHDWQEDGVRARRELVRRVRDGVVPGAVIET
jgi:hypothetical protein